MGKTRGPYEAEYPAGTSVRIAPREALQAFIREWKWHHPLHPEQLSFASYVASVKDVSFYHSGDELYELEEMHEQNLRPVGVR